MIRKSASLRAQDAPTQTSENGSTQRVVVAYVTAVFVVSVVLVATATWYIPGDPASHWRWFLAFLLIGLFVEAGFSRLSVSSATTSIAFIPFLGSILLVGPAWAMAVAGCTELLAETLIRRKPTIKVIHNTSKEVVSIGTAGYAYVLLGGTPSGETLSVHFLGFLTATIVYFTLNQGAAIVAIALSTGTPIRQRWTQLVGGSLVYDFASGPLAILLALLFIKLGWLGLLVVMLPMFFVRHVYEMNIRLGEVNRELQESEEASRRVVEVSPVAIIVNCDGRIEYANPTAVRLLGSTNQALLEGKSVSEFAYHAAGDDELVNSGHKSEVGRGIRLERLRRLDGQIVDVETTEIPFNYRGKPANQLIIRDVTERIRAEQERRLLEAQVQQAQKLESLGVLAGGIAHDFNNLLVGVLGNSSLALETLPAHAPERAMVEQIEKAALRASELTNQMLAYSGKGKFVIEQTNLNQLVSEMSHLLEASISKKANLVFDFADDLPPVEVDATQIRQVVMNLITNASDALKGQGTITVKTGVRYVDQAYLADAYLPDPLEDGLCIFLEVTDSGCGMDMETRLRIFDPFFTTKFTGRGLGLASVLGIVRSHRGAIKLESEPGTGTTFTVLIPGTKSVLESSAKDTDAPQGLTRSRPTGTVLVVDDEDPVRHVAREMLRRFGYDVLTAIDGSDGVEQFRRNASEIVAVLLDVAMPQMTGEEVFDEIHTMSPTTPVVLMSGYAEEEVVGRFVGRGVKGLLKKPFTADALRRKVHEAVHAGELFVT